MTHLSLPPLCSPFKDFIAPLSRDAWRKRWEALGFVEDKGAGYRVFNLGTGQGYSVLDIVKAYSKACGFELPYKMAARRPGDVAVVYADPSYAVR